MSIDISKNINIEYEVSNIIIKQLNSNSFYNKLDQKYNFNNLDLNSCLIKDLSLEELDLFEIFIKLEDLFKLEIPDGDNKKLETVNNIINYIKANIKN